MIITCARSELQNAVLNISRAVAAKSPIPALEGILFKASGDSIFLCGYDLSLGITTSLPADVREEGEVIFGAKLFGDIIRSLPDEEVRIRVDEKFAAEIVSGESTFHIVGIAASEYPDLPSVSGGAEITLPQATLKSMIRQTLFAVSTSDAKPIHTGTLFVIKDKTIRLVAVDGCRLAMRTEPVQSDEATDFVVPGKTLGEVLKLMDESDGEVTIGVGRRHIIFSVNRYSVISRLLEGEFLDYKSALPKDKKTEVTVSTRTMIESVERVSLLITDRLKSPVRCVIGEDTVKLFCTTTMGRATDQISAEISGDQLEIGFNNKYLLDALRAAETDEVRLQLGGPISPMLVLPKEGDAFSFLVLPVRLRSEM